ncbi:MAG: PhoH family protein [Candidatus Krumholzibacteria bacterium]|nr:PhoH family protein [Candidatus Krumholzibacteria bacterium]
MGLKTKKRVLSFEGVNPLKLFGTREIHLALVEKRYPGVVVVRGEDIILKGRDDEIQRLTEFFGELIEIARNGRTINEQDFNYILNKKNGEDARNEYEDLEKEVLVSTKRGRQIKPRTPGQKRYVDAILGHDITFGIGPAGTGKTYLAVACAVAALKARNVDRIFLVRPVVEAGESLGFLPGDFQAKLDPYVRPILDALYDMLGQDRTTKLMENGTIEIAPLAYMRGRTLDNAYVILDEAQNTTELQMKMFLTRLGQNAKSIVNGDITQIDLEPPTRSGLLAAERILADVEGLEFVYLGRDDIVRHRLVRRIIRAFDGGSSEDPTDDRAE